MGLCITIDAQVIGNGTRHISPLVDIATNCTMSTSSSLGGIYVASQSIDRDFSTRWLTVNNVPTAWLQCDLPSPVAITAYAIRAQPVTGANFPRDFTMSFDNGSGWSVFDSHIDIPNSSTNEKRFYFVDDAVTSDSFRLDMTDKNTGSTYYMINELYLYTSSFDYATYEYNIVSASDDVSSINLAGSTVDFAIESAGFELLGDWSADIQVCVDADCDTNPANNQFSQYMLDHDEQHDIAITASGAFTFEGINVIEQATYYSPSGGGGEPVDNDAIVDLDIGGVDAQYHYIITAGQTVIAQILIFGILSLWAMSLIVIFRSRKR